MTNAPQSPYIAAAPGTLMPIDIKERLYLAARARRKPEEARKDMQWAIEKYIEETDERLKGVIDKGVSIWARAKPAEWAQSFFEVTLVWEGDGQKVLSPEYWKLRRLGMAEPLAAEIRLERLTAVYAQQVALYTEASMGETAQMGAGVSGTASATEGLTDPAALPPPAPLDVTQFVWAFWPRLIKGSRKWVPEYIARSFRKAIQAHPEAFVAFLEGGPPGLLGLGD